MGVFPSKHLSGLTTFKGSLLLLGEDLTTHRPERDVQDQAALSQAPPPPCQLLPQGSQS